MIVPGILMWCQPIILDQSVDCAFACKCFLLQNVSVCW